MKAQTEEKILYEKKVDGKTVRLFSAIAGILSPPLKILKRLKKLEPSLTFPANNCIIYSLLSMGYTIQKSEGEGGS